MTDFKLTLKDGERTLLRVSGVFPLTVGDVHALVGLLLDVAAPISVPAAAPQAGAKKAICENPDCGRRYTPRMRIQRTCGRPECVAWRRRQKPLVHYAQRNTASNEGRDGNGKTGEITIVAGEGVLKGAL